MFAGVCSSSDLMHVEIHLYNDTLPCAIMKYRVFPELSLMRKGLGATIGCLFAALASRFFYQLLTLLSNTTLTLFICLSSVGSVHLY